jgi:uncharacterized protein YjbI with pentapeptide repeats
MINKWIDDQLFTSIDYTGKKLAQTEFNNCTFQNCNFTNADLSESDFEKCRFENCNFAMARITGSGMKNVQFSGCKLVGINFDSCSNFLFSVNFNQCALDYSSFTAKKMKETTFVNCSLKEVDFSGTDLSNAIFQNCDLSKAVFYQTNLEKADFRTAENYSIDPEKNKLKKAKFSFSGISGLLEKYNIVIE